MNPSTAFKIVRVMNSQSVGTSNVSSSGVDASGYESVTFIVAFGAITDGTPSVKVQQSDDDAASDTYDDLASSSVSVGSASDDNKMLVVEIHRPRKKFLRAFVTRGGATGCIIDGVIALLADPTYQPSALDASVVARETHVSPAEGTA